MIIGIGSDLTDVRRIERVMSRFQRRFIARCFTQAEQERAEAGRGAGTHGNSYAKRFCAKEACAKALGTGFNHGVFPKDISVVNDQNGAPSLVLTGGALERLQRLVPENKAPRIHLTLSDEPPMVQAFVIIEAL